MSLVPLKYGAGLRREKVCARARRVGAMGGLFFSARSEGFFLRWFG
jgi:hypothetical protein